MSKSSARAAMPADDRAGTPYRWIVLLLAWTAFAVSIMDRSAWSNAAAGFGQTLGMPVAALGVFASAFYAGYVVSNAAGGVATDWLGPRRLLGFALLPLGGATFLFGSAGGMATGIALQAVMGLLAGADYAAGGKLVVAWFDWRDRGRAMGIFMTATSVGVALTNLIAPALMNLIGWRGVYQILGSLTAAVAIACLMFLRDSPVPQERSTRPDFGLLQRSRNLAIVALAGFGALWGTWGFAFWANALMVRGHHLSPVQSGYVVAIFAIGAVIAKPLVGLLSDWLGGRRKLLSVICLIGFVAALLAFGTLNTAPGFMLLAPLLGIGAFAYSPLLAALVAEMAGRPLAGSALGITNALWQIGSAVVPLVVGFVFQSTQSFEAAFATLAAGPALAALALAFVREDEASLS